MNKFQVKLLPKAFEDINNIYSYIIDTLQNSVAALKLVESLEEAILSLETMPYRGMERKIGVFAEKGYRQLFIDNFTVIYRISSTKRFVTVVHVVYSKRSY